MTINTSTSLKCAEKGCSDVLRLVRETQHAFGLEGVHFTNALYEAATVLGWRMVEDGFAFCPKHASTFECVGCGQPTMDCFCMDGPRFEARRPYEFGGHQEPGSAARFWASVFVSSHFMQRPMYSDSPTNVTSKLSAPNEITASQGEARRLLRRFRMPS